jgi:hypothetical protein
MLIVLGIVALGVGVAVFYRATDAWLDPTRDLRAQLERLMEPAAEATSTGGPTCFGVNCR